MPNLASVLKEEIRRLAKKEARAQVGSLKSSAAQHRREIASLKRRAKEQERVIAQLRRRLAAEPRSASTAVENGTVVRFSPAWVAKHREKLELSAADYAALVGVSALTIYNWEKGKTRPQQRQLEAWAAVRNLGKREAWRKLEEIEA